MGVERRMYLREEPKGMKLSVVHGHGEVLVDVRNISAGGAFVEFEGTNGSVITASDVGSEARLRMEDGSSFTAPRCKILRYTEDGRKKYLGLAFTSGRSLSSTL
jgi:hypothetical protein